MTGNELPALWEEALMEEEQRELEARRQVRKELEELWEKNKENLPWTDAT